jgi:transaldolase
MTKPQQLFAQRGPRLDKLTHPYLRDGTLARMVADGIRGVTASPSVLALEDQGTVSFHQSFQDVLGALDTKARQLVNR